MSSSGSETSLPGRQSTGQISAEPASEALSHGSRNFSARCGEGLLAHHLHWPPIGTVFPVRENLPGPNDGSKCTGVAANASDGEQHVEPSVYFDLQPDQMVVPASTNTRPGTPRALSTNRSSSCTSVIKFCASSRRLTASPSSSLLVTSSLAANRSRIVARTASSSSCSWGHMRRDAERLHETGSLHGVEERHQWQELTLVSCLKRV